ncbi:Uncharacterised protein [Mycobacteroides abscessus subsp. abscessus]|nr:Uncharacterised protein [Mycobacteroides abscessus subsp. abscessus]
MPIPPSSPGSSPSPAARSSTCSPSTPPTAPAPSMRRSTSTMPSGSRSPTPSQPVRNRPSSTWAERPWGSRSATTSASPSSSPNSAAEALASPSSPHRGVRGRGRSSSGSCSLEPGRSTRTCSSSPSARPIPKSAGSTCPRRAPRESATASSPTRTGTSSSPSAGRRRSRSSRSTSVSPMRPPRRFPSS